LGTVPTANALTAEDRSTSGVKALLDLANGSYGFLFTY
jgi:hypothetical protein